MLGRESRAQLATCHPELQRLFADVAAHIEAGELRSAGIVDIKILCGWRGEADQNREFAEGDSQLRWPESKHNAMFEGKPRSLAVDAVPYPVSWKDGNHEHVLRGFVLSRAAVLGIRIRVISWDLPHYELVL